MYFSASEGGRTTGSVPAVLFLWNNFQYFFQMSRLFNVHASGRSSWSAQGIGAMSFLRAEWFITQFRSSPTQGVIHAHSYPYVPGPLAPFESLWVYKKLPSGDLMYFGGAQGVFPAVYVPASLFLLGWGGRMAKRMAEAGGQAAARITTDPEYLLRVFGEEAYELYNEYVNECTSIESRAAPNGRFFRTAAIRPLSLIGAAGAAEVGAILGEFDAGGSAWAGMSDEQREMLSIDLALEAARTGMPRGGIVAIRESVDSVLNRHDGGDRKKMVALSAYLKQVTARPLQLFSSTEAMLRNDTLRLRRVLEQLRDSATLG
jgi:hypothetical protein